MKNYINILFLKDVGNYLDGENLKYIAINSNNNIFIIKDLPIVYIDNLQPLMNYLCYDYDLISNINKVRYQDQYKALKKVNENVYSIQTKKYIKKNNPSFT